MVRVGQVPVFWTLSVIMNIGHTCMIPFFFGDGWVECGLGWSESNNNFRAYNRLVASLALDRPERLPDGDFPSRSRLFLATPLRRFSVPTPSVLCCSCMLLWHCRGPRHLSLPSLFFIPFITLVSA